MSPNMRQTDPGHVTRGQTSTKLVPKPYITEAGDRLGRESPPAAEQWEFSAASGPLGKGDRVALWRGGRWEVHTLCVGRIRLTLPCLALSSVFKVPE